MCNDVLKREEEKMMKAEYFLDYSAIEPNKETHVYLMLRLESPSVKIENRKPLNISMVLDRSGSMSGAKIEYTKKAACCLVKRLSSEDHLSVVAYDDVVENPVPPTSVKNKEHIEQKINALTARNMTNLSAGWLEGLGHVEKNQEKGKINRLLLMTDGLANEGITDDNKLKEIASKWFKKGIATTTLGFGQDFKEDLLVSIADAGGGNFYYIDTPDKAPEVFQEELGDLMALVAQNVKITVNCKHNSKIVKLLNEYPKIDENSWSFGDVYADEFKTLLFKIKVPAIDRGEIELAEVLYEYDQVHPEIEKKSIPLSIKLKIEEEAAKNCGRNEDVLREYLLLKSALQKQKAIQAADRGDIKMSLAIFTEMEDTLTQNVHLSVDIEKERERVQKISSEISKTSSVTPGTRKEILYQQISSQRSRGHYRKKK